MKNENISSNYDCIVIGAGISGVSFAAQLRQKNQRVLLIDKSRHVGGQVYSVQSKVADGFWMELGAHTCYNSYTHLLRLAEAFNVQQSVLPLGKGGYVAYAKDKVRSLVSQVGYFSFAFHFLNFFRAKRDDKTVKEYFLPIVGPSNYEHLFSKAFRAVICQPADDYPAELFLKRREGRNEAYPRKYSFQRGISAFLEELTREAKIEVKLNAEVVRLKTLESGGYEIETAGGDLYRAGRIALAADPHSSSVLLREVEPEVATLLAEISMTTLTSIGVVVPRSAVKLKTVAGIIALSDAFMSVVSRDLLPHDQYRGFAFHFMDTAATYENKKALILQVLGIEEKDVLEHVSFKHFLPALRLSSRNMAERLREATKQKDIYILGNYFYGLSLEDCVNRSDDEAARYN